MSDPQPEAGSHAEWLASVNQARNDRDWKRLNELVLSQPAPEAGSLLNDAEAPRSLMSYADEWIGEVKPPEIAELNVRGFAAWVGVKKRGVAPQPDSPAADGGVQCDWDENGYCRCKPAGSLREWLLSRRSNEPPQNAYDAGYDEAISDVIEHIRLEKQ